MRGVAPPPASWLLLALSATVGVLAVIVRLWRHDVAFDVFVDEFVYQQLGASVRDGGLPHYANGDLFFLHPPGYFYLQGLWQGLWQSLTGADPSDPVLAVFDGRILNGLLGGLTAGLVVWLAGRRVLLWGLLAGLVVLVEPFMLRQNGRVLLETAVMVWVLLGLALLLPLASGSTSRWRAVAGGLAFGGAVLTKDLAVMVTLLPLLLSWFLQPRQQRPWLLVAAVSTVVPYLVYLLAVLATGQGGAWWAAKGSGILRAVGLQVTTGFSAPGSPPLWDQVLVQLMDFGATFALIGLGAVCAAWVLWSDAEDVVLTALVYIGGFVLLGYSVTAGTIEEHFMYFLLVPSVVVVAGAGALVLAAPGPRPALRRQPATRGRSGRPSAPAWRWPLLRDARGSVLLLALLLMVALNAATYTRWAQADDNGFMLARQYLLENAEPGAGVIIVNGTSEFALRDAFDVGPYTSEEDRALHDVEYLLVPWKEVEQGYTYVTLDTVQELVPLGTAVLEHESRTYGSVALYRLPPP